ncbi:hypothetical protein ASPWEDRAFT_46716 [Aspergillus wentii DTO 134E9]|uniref:F-box domain-containing protein n=1 Tax=Aspergillus wentii DTO 134E9 TaxID=1073089 RepID=A0A1L9R524_ASPWE|nr:uncharacterized protein ASPWEDRAFT_46716 [Aspergillus wentii DTO 134E9]KAI9927256.1 hypothetical protein MW887_003643 [Aspergillus wentii]OJJ29987.1 hypothetical protein ASPWEDRAFT_46716 [Aspergillus wentii DTO 134E9]
MPNTKEPVGIESLPMEVYDLITLKANRRYGDDRYHWRSESAENRIKRLKTLRLVNRRFYHSASRLLFRRISTDLTSRGTEEGIPIKRLHSLCHSPHADHVQTLFIVLPGFSRSNDTVKRYTEEFKEWFPRCLGKLTRLKTLEFDIEYAYWKEAKGHSDVPTAIWRSLADAMFTCLRDARLENLQNLQIKLPNESTYCLGSQSRLPATLMPSQNSMSNLSSLHIDHQTMEPGIYYQADVLRLVGLVKSLHTLEITGSQALFADIAPVDLLISPNMNLRVLKIMCVTFPFRILLSLLQNNKQTLEKIVLNGVDLHDGRWKDILKEICQLPSVHHVGLCSCNYSRTGQSSFLRRSSRFYECDVVRTGEIRSLSAADILAIHPVRHHLNRNREKIGLERIRPIKTKWVAGQCKYKFLGRFDYGA